MFRIITITTEFLSYYISSAKFRFLIKTVITILYIDHTNDHNKL